MDRGDGDNVKGKNALFIQLHFFNVYSILKEGNASLFVDIKLIELFLKIIFHVGFH